MATPIVRRWDSRFCGHLVGGLTRRARTTRRPMVRPPLVEQSKADGNSSKWSRSDRKLGARCSDRAVVVLCSIHGSDYRPHACRDKGYTPDRLSSIATAPAVKGVEGRKGSNKGHDPERVW